MLWCMFKQFWFWNVCCKLLVVFMVFLVVGFIFLLLVVLIDIGDKMFCELKFYGVNILIELVGQVVLLFLFGEKSNLFMGQDFLDQVELFNIKDIFWCNNIVGFVLLLSGEIEVNGQDILLLGIYFNQFVDVFDEEDYYIGQ